MARRVPMPALEETAVEKEFGNGGQPEPTARRIFQTISVFPFQIFPDELVIDEFKVTVVNRTFFNSGQTRSVLFRDIMGVAVQNGLFFATLNFRERGFPADNTSINYLWSDQAFRARRLIEGLVIMDKEKVDISKLSLMEIVNEAERLGRERGL